MAELKSKGASASAIKLDVDVDLKVGGKAMKHLPDGTTEPSAVRQEFIRIEKGRVAKGDWLINPATKESHKVIEPLDDYVRIGTEGGGIIRADWEDVISTLLLVVDV